jgi:allantoin racemase
MRILLVNPNTTTAVTETMAVAARLAASPGTEIKPVTARFGARIIGTRVERAVSAVATIDQLAREAEGCDAAIIGASVDSGIEAAREMLDIPVVAITEAALHVACLTGGRIGAITMSANSVAMLREMAASYGLATRLGPVHALPLTPLELLGDIDAGVAQICAAAAAMQEHEPVDVLVLIGAVMAGVRQHVQLRMDIPVVEGVSAAVVLAEALTRLQLSPARSGSYATPAADRMQDLFDSLRR